MNTNSCTTNLTTCQNHPSATFVKILMPETSLKITAFASWNSQGLVGINFNFYLPDGCQKCISYRASEMPSRSELLSKLIEFLQEIDLNSFYKERE
jgi:hypothetical protein